MNNALPVRLAFVDSHSLFRISCSSLLESDGDIKIIISVADSARLQEMIEKSTVKPDVCLVDICLPGMNGRQVVSVLRSRWPEVRILVLTGFEGDPYVSGMICSGINGYLLKRIHPDELRDAIFGVLANGYYFNEIFTKEKLDRAWGNKAQMPVFTEMELELLKMSLADMSYKELAAFLNASKKSVESCSWRLFRKLEVRSRIGLARYAIRHGFVPFETALHHEGNRY